MDHVAKTIEDLKRVVAEKEVELNESKKTVNSLCKLVGKPPMYVLAESAAVNHAEDLRGDEYYGQPLATAITMILEGRKLTGAGPATVREIYDQLIEGGYRFDTKNENNAIRGIRISMRKNRKFHRLPNKRYGLTAWYPNAKDESDVENKAPTAEPEETLPEDSPVGDPTQNGDEPEEKQEDEKEAT